MPRLAANLSMMFNEVGFLDRFEAAARAGFAAVEFLFPYEYPPAALRARLAAGGLRQVLFNMPPCDWARGERGLASLPGRQEEFRAGAQRALDYAVALECGLVHCMAGIPGAGVPFATAASVYAANLAWAAERARDAGVKLVIEPINHRDMPGFHLNTTAQAAAVVAAIGGDRLGLLFDIYHCQVTRATSPAAWRRICPSSPICRWPTCRRATSRAAARSAGTSCSGASTRWATPAGSVANTARPATPWPDSPGGRNSASDPLGEAAGLGMSHTGRRGRHPGSRRRMMPGYTRNASGLALSKIWRGFTDESQIYSRQLEN